MAMGPPPRRPAIPPSPDYDQRASFLSRRLPLPQAILLCLALSLSGWVMLMAIGAIILHATAPVHRTVHPVFEQRR